MVTQGLAALGSHSHLQSEAEGETQATTAMPQELKLPRGQTGAVSVGRTATPKLWSSKLCSQLALLPPSESLLVPPPIGEPHQKPGSQGIRGSSLRLASWAQSRMKRMENGPGRAKVTIPGLSGIATFVFQNFAPHFSSLDICNIRYF